jgi:hypothetical protein
MGIVRLRKRTLCFRVLGILVSGIVVYIAYLEYNLQRNEFILDLKTGDQEIWIDGYHNFLRLPTDLRSRVQAESLPIAESERYLNLAPAFRGTHDVSLFGGIMESGSPMPSNIYHNFEALGLWLKVDPPTFARRLHEYQQFMLNTYQAGNVPLGYLIPEELYAENEKSSYLDESNFFDLERFHANKDTILQQPINGPKNQR